MTRGHKCSSILTPEMKAAAKELTDYENIVIQRADKSSTFVILDKHDHLSKMATILGDRNKFKVVTKNLTNDIKTKINKIICNNKNLMEKLPLIKGDHKLGYAYGSVKTQKRGYPLHPITTQKPSVTYNLAKHLNELISPYIPAGYSLKSSREFLDIIKSISAAAMGLLDIESLFINVLSMRPLTLYAKRSVTQMRTQRAPQSPLFVSGATRVVQKQM